MYFLKNSRCVLRKSQWFSSNIFERNFKSFPRSRVRWPEDDPTKPPLRLNIPKDKPVSGPSNLTPQISLNSPQTNTNTEKITMNWVDAEVAKTEEEIPKDGIMEKSIVALAEVGNSREVLNKPNFSVGTKSSEPLISMQKDENLGNLPSEKVKHFKLTKTRSYEDLKPGEEGDVLRKSNPEQKRGILKIEVQWNGPQDPKPVMALSEVKTTDATSDEEIKALAEAIANELSPNAESVDASQTKSSDKQDEALLVIVNVTDKSVPEDAVTPRQLSAESQMQYQEMVEAKSSNTSLDVGCYGTRIQVRNLDLSDEIEKNAHVKELGRSGKMRESGTGTIRLQQVSSGVSDLGKKMTLDGQFGRCSMEQTQYEQNRSRPSENESTMKAENKEKKAEVFETTFRKLRANRSQIPVGRKIPAMGLPQKKLSTVSMDKSRVDFTQSKLPRYVSKFGMGNKTAEVGKKYSATSKMEVTLTDDPREVLIHADHKMVRKSCGEMKNVEDDKFKKSNTIRSYHNSCKKQCKITNGIGEGKPSIVVMNVDKKSGTGSKGEGDNPKNVNGKTDPLHLTKDYPKSKFDKSCDVVEESSNLPDLNGPNNIYLQEESIINNKSQGTEQETVQRAIPSLEQLQKLDDINDERYELDISDVTTSSKPVKVPYRAANPSNRALAGDERTRFEIFRDASSERFEMNANCLSKDGETGEKSSDEGGIAEFPATGKVETTVPKISDNVASLANEELTETKAAPQSVDSLSMMKQVREMVYLDLKNAEKIFMAGEEEAFKIEEKASATPQGDVSPAPLKSVIIYNEETNRFYINTNELEQAAKQKVSASDNVKILDFNQEEFKGELAVYVNMPQESTNAIGNCILKNGNSILVYDEKTRQWVVDFNLLKEGEQTKVQQPEALNEKVEISPPEVLPEKSRKEGESKDQSLNKPEELPLAEKPRDVQYQDVQSANKTSESKSRGKKDHGKELDAKEIRKKNSDLYDDVFIGIKKPKKEDEASESTKWAKKAEKPSSEHYVSENIVEMSKNNTVKPRSNKVETVKLNISTSARPPSKVTEINLNRKKEEGKGSLKKDGSDGESGTGKGDQPNGTFYKKFEKYKTPFSDPEYEEKPMKINSDLSSNPNLKKLDSWNKTLVLQEYSKSSENVEGWLKDETDKMATLLLKVLQDAADGNSRRRVAAKSVVKGNPYEAIRKKQENNSPGPARAKKKEPSKKKATASVQLKRPESKESAKAEEKKAEEERSRKGQFPIIEDDSHVEVLAPDSHLPKERNQVPQLPVAVLHNKDDIPGPRFLKKLSKILRYLPDLGCQTTIFLLMRMFQLAKAGLSLFSSEAMTSRNDPFQRLFTKYGPIVKLQGPLSGDVVLVNRPEDLSSVFSQARAFPARSVLDSVEKCRLFVRKKNFPQGITQSCNGVEWDVVRESMIDVGSKGCIHYFHTLKLADAMLVNRIQGIRNNQQQVPDDFINEVKKWSMEGLCGVLFDKSLGFLEKKNFQIQWIAESERLMRHLGEATDHLCQCESSFQTWRFIKTPSMGGLNQAYQSLDLIISKYVYQADLTLRKKKKALLNNKSDANKNLNFLESVLLNDRMAPDEITANLIDMLLIGVNTTTTALAFLLYNLAQNSRVQCLLFKEIKDLLPKKSSTLNYHQLHSLKYLQACLKESLRLNVPIPLVLRVLPSDIALSNYRIPNGTHIVIDTQTACMKEQIFDDPKRFKPERWLELDYVHPFSAIPFSNGPRSAFVKRLAEIQLWTCVAQIVRNYEIEYHFGEIRPSKGVIAYPDKPLRLTFIERKD